MVAVAPLTKGQKLAYSSASLGSALVYQAFTTYVIFFYVDVLKLPAALVSSAMVVYGLWNAINDPLAGQISDRTRTRWGRRIPYVAAISLPLVLLFALVWTPPASLVNAPSHTGLFVYFVAVIFLFDTAFTFVALNWTALFPEMFTTPAERAEVSGYRQVFAVLGLILGVAIPPLIYGSLGWAWMAWGFAAVSLVFWLLSLRGSREHPEFFQEEALGLGEALKRTVANRAFLTFMASNLAIQFGFVVLQASVPFYAKYVLRIPEQQQTVMLGAAFLVALLFIGLWARLAARWEVRRVNMLAALLFGLAVLPYGWLSGFWGAVAATGLVGLGLAGILVIQDMLVADVVDEDELRTGVRREGMYYGVNGFVIRLGVSLQAVVIGAVLSRTGYDPSLAVQPESAVDGIRFLMAGVPALAMAAALLALWLYPLHGTYLSEVKQRLAALHARKQAAGGLAIGDRGTGRQPAEPAEESNRGASAGPAARI